MLSTVLNIIMFEDCRNQWSMSRPLLGLILLNEEVCTASVLILSLLADHTAVGMILSVICLSMTLWHSGLVGVGD